MKRKWLTGFLILFLFGTCHSRSPFKFGDEALAACGEGNTTNVGLCKPSDGDTSWGNDIRGNFDTVDTALGAQFVSLNANATLPNEVLLSSLSGSAFPSDLVKTTGSQTLSSKTLSSPILTGNVNTPLTPNRCVKTDGSGNLSAASADCSSGGTPGGSTTQVQFNNTGVFAGDTDLTWNSTTNILTTGNSSIGGSGDYFETGNFRTTLDALSPGSIRFAAQGGTNNESVDLDLESTTNSLIISSASGVNTFKINFPTETLDSLTAGSGGYDVSNRIIAFYKMEDNAANTTVVDTQGAFNGTSSANTSTMTTTGKIGNALNFIDTSSQYISLGSSSTLKPAGDFSACAWVSTTVSGVTNNIMGNRSASGTNVGWRMTINTSNFITVAVDVGSTTISTTGTTPINSGAFFFVCTVRSGSTVTAYVNGVAEGTPGSGTGDAGTGAGDMEIGRSPLTPDYWLGKIDNVMLFNNDLTSTEISKLYNSGAGTESLTGAASGFAQHTVGGNLPGCRMVKDSDGVGWTKTVCNDGVCTNSIDADGVC